MLGVFFLVCELLSHLCNKLVNAKDSRKFIAPHITKNHVTQVGTQNQTATNPGQQTDICSMTRGHMSSKLGDDAQTVDIAHEPRNLGFCNNLELIEVVLSVVGILSSSSW